MNETTLLIAFIAVTSVAVLLQTLILAGMYFSTRKLGKRLEALSTQVEEQVMPMVEKVRGMIDENAPMIHSAITSLTETSSLVRSQAGRIDEAVTEMVGMARKQAVRADELATRTMQRIDITAGVMQHAATFPIRQLSALKDGVVAGLREFFGGRKSRRAKPVPGDEMFI
jgi:hypothetical protein